MLLFFFTVNYVYPQFTAEEIKLYIEGDNYFSKDEFRKASDFFTMLLDKYPDNPKFNYRAGQCFLNIKTQEEKAVAHFIKSVVEIDLSYNESSIRGLGAPPEAWLQLGIAYHVTGNYIDASFAYHKYLTYLERGSWEYIETVKRIKGLGASYDALFRPTGYELVTMPEYFNTRYSDYNPVVSGDKKTFAFTAHHNGNDYIFISYLADGEWAKPVDITEQVGSRKNFFTSALSFDGTELYLVDYDPFNSDIFVSRYENGNWTEMARLDKTINTMSIETGVCLSAGGDTLYFCSNRAGGYGGVDIYYSAKLNNKWGKPVNLGNVINSSGDEGAPKISANGNTLFFCSNGHEGIGGFDIFYSEKDSNGAWGKPIGFPVPVNSADDDMSFFFFDDIKSGYISKLQEGTNNRDIFVIRFIQETENDSPVAIRAENFNQALENNEERPEITYSVETPDSIEKQLIKGDEHADTQFEVVSDTLFVSNDETILSGDVFSGSDKQVPGGEYTIQVIAFRNPHNAEVFSRLNKNYFFVSPGGDGIWRYSFGRYSTAGDASADLEALRKMGFSDAFVRNIDEIDNFNAQQ
ncbi:MAG: PD40 domain-containing protein [Bacteroidales bacterium]|nr:PD40 domain-containing protein [Bacteroidales bacterium]